jgi:hypothetical protein
MSALLTRSPAAGRAGEDDWRTNIDADPTHEGADASPTLDGVDAGPTLDDVISRAWEVLRADVPAACPACGDELLPRASAGAGIVGGRCESCGTSLS